jgi:hypothetical protein
MASKATSGAHRQTVNFIKKYYTLSGKNDQRWDGPENASKKMIFSEEKKLFLRGATRYQQPHGN